VVECFLIYDINMVIANASRTLRAKVRIPRHGTPS
jgi:hypothetical protein